MIIILNNPIGCLDLKFLVKNVNMAFCGADHHSLEPKEVLCLADTTDVLNCVLE